jgi:hypothetical protein
MKQISECGALLTHTVSQHFAGVRKVVFVILDLAPEHPMFARKGSKDSNFFQVLVRRRFLVV